MRVRTFEWLDSWLRGVVTREPFDGLGELVSLPRKVAGVDQLVVDQLKRGVREVVHPQSEDRCRCRDLRIGLDKSLVSGLHTSPAC